MPNRISRRKALAAAGFGLAVPRGLVALDSRETAPKFRAKTLDGELFNNDSIQGKVLLLQFWTTWCPYCKSDLAAVEKIGREFEEQGLVVLGVDVGESKKTVKHFLENSPRSSKIVLTDDTNLAAIFDANRFPLYVVIDRKGKLAGTQSGAGGEGPLRRLLRKAGLESSEEPIVSGELLSSPRRE